MKLPNIPLIWSSEAAIASAVFASNHSGNDFGNQRQAFASSRRASMLGLSGAKCGPQLSHKMREMRHFGHEAVMPGWRRQAEPRKQNLERLASCRQRFRSDL
jgi:hypothetical protein